MSEPIAIRSVAAPSTAIGIVADRLYSSPVHTAPNPAASARRARSAAARNRRGPRPPVKIVRPRSLRKARRPLPNEPGDALGRFAVREQLLDLLLLEPPSVAQRQVERRADGAPGGRHRRARQDPQPPGQLQ